MSLKNSCTNLICLWYETSKMVVCRLSVVRPVVPHLKLNSHSQHIVFVCTPIPLPPSATLLLADLSGLWCCYTFLPCRPLLRFPQNVSAWVSSLMHVCVMCQHFQIPHRPHMHQDANTTTIHTIHIDIERRQQYHLTDISPTHHRLSQNMKD